MAGLAVTAAALLARPAANTAAVAPPLPYNQAPGPEEPHRSAAVQPHMLGGTAKPGAAAAVPGEDSPLETASELFAALASASEFACLADAEQSQQ